jgi:hypothetical protein
MGGLPNLGEIRALVERDLPSCFELEAVDLGFGEMTPGTPAQFIVEVRIVRTTSEPEPLGWGYDLGRRVRQRYPPSEFGFSIRERASRVDS